MKVRYIILVCLLFLLIVLTFFISWSDENTNDGSSPTSNYSILTQRVEVGNEYIKEKGVLTDSCFPYRPFHRGCYYEGKIKFTESSSRNGSIILGNLGQYGLDEEDVLKICKKQIVNGSIAYCRHSCGLYEDCLDFAGSDEYLVRICNLEEGETIPTEGFWDPEYKENPIQTRVENF
jgi:hypothetical protein